MDHVLCVGREPELARLRALIDDAGANAGGLVLLEGPAGIGKTTLARCCLQVATQAGGVGYLVASFGPRLESPLGLWARLAAEVAHGGQSVPSDLLGGAADQLHPHARYAAVHSLVRSLAPSPAVIVFDDLHGADETSLVILAQLAPALSALGVLVVGTLRGVASHPDEVARDAIDALGPWAETLVVREMDVNAVRELTTSLAGHDSEAWAIGAQRILTERSGGNPLVLRSILDELGVRRGARPSANDIASLPYRPAAEVIGRHLVSLSEPCHEMLEVLALVGGSASRSLVADVLGRDVSLDIDQAVAAGVISGSLDDSTVQFVHPVFAEAVESRIGHGSPDAHRAIADALKRRGHLRDLPAIVRHLERAEGRATDAELSRAALDAAEYARRAGDHITAARLFDVAIDSGEAADAVELLLQSAAAHLFGGTREDGWERAQQAFTLAGPTRPAEQARAALLFAQQRDYSTETPLAVELLRAALRDLPEPNDTATDVTKLRTEVLAALSVLEMSLPVPIELGGLVDIVDLRGKPAEGLAWFWITRPQVARPLADEALDLARASGDVDLLARVAFSWRQSYCDPGHLEDRLAVTGEAAAKASSPADRALAAIATVLDQLEAGNRAAVDAALVELAGLAAATGDAALRWRHGQLAAMVAIASGKPHDAERWSAEAFVHGAQAGESGRWVVRVVQSTVLSVEASRDPEPSVELIATNLDSLAYPPMRGGALSILARAGRRELVAARLPELVAHLLADRGREASWLSACAGAADAVATLRLGEYAEALLDVIVPFADHIALDGLGLHCHGCIARPAARLADLAGRRDEAADLRALARERDGAAGLQRFLLEDQLDELEARLTDHADQRRIRDELDRVAVAAGSAGLVALEQRARALAENRNSTELTDRQRDVLSALAAGLTYKETGDRLGFSHSTIRHEAMRIYALLGARDRDDAVALARKRGLLADDQPG